MAANFYEPAYIMHSMAAKPPRHKLVQPAPNLSGAGSAAALMTTEGFISQPVDESFCLFIFGLSYGRRTILIAVSSLSAKAKASLISLNLNSLVINGLMATSPCTTGRSEGGVHT